MVIQKPFSIDAIPGRIFIGLNADKSKVPANTDKSIKVIIRQNRQFNQIIGVLKVSRSQEAFQIKTIISGKLEELFVANEDVVCRFVRARALFDLIISETDRQTP